MADEEYLNIKNSISDKRWSEKYPKLHRYWLERIEGHTTLFNHELSFACWLINNQYDELLSELPEEEILALVKL